MGSNHRHSFIVWIWVPFCPSHSVFELREESNLSSIPSSTSYKAAQSDSMTINSLPWLLSILESYISAWRRSFLTVSMSADQCDLTKTFSDLTLSFNFATAALNWSETSLCCTARNPFLLLKNCIRYSVFSWSAFSNFDFKFMYVVQP